MGDSSALLNQPATQRLKELNAYELNVGEDTQDAEIFRSEVPEIDFDMKNQQNLEYSKANLVANPSSVSKHEKEVHLEPNNFQNSLNKFKNISD